MESLAEGRSTKWNFATPTTSTATTNISFYWMIASKHMPVARTPKLTNIVHIPFSEVCTFFSLIIHIIVANICDVHESYICIFYFSIFVVFAALAEAIYIKFKFSSTFEIEPKWQIHLCRIAQWHRFDPVQSKCNETKNKNWFRFIRRCACVISLVVGVLSSQEVTDFSPIK